MKFPKIKKKSKKSSDQRICYNCKYDDKSKCKCPTKWGLHSTCEYFAWNALNKSM